MKAVYSLFAIIAFVISAFSVWAGLREASLARLDAREDFENFAALRQGVPERAMSVRSDRALLLACDDILGGRLGLVQPEEVLAEIAEGCLERASEIASKLSSWGLPPLVQANAAIHLGRTEEARQWIETSQSLAAFESWMAERRVLAGLRLMEFDQANIENVLDKDLSSLLQSRLGREFVVRVFEAHPNQRPRIETLAGSMSDETQREFVNALRGFR